MLDFEIFVFKVAKKMEGVTKALDKAMASMDLEQVGHNKIFLVIAVKSADNHDFRTIDFF